MATIQKLERKDGTRYRVLIRRAGYKTTTKVFEKKRDAEAWARSLEGNIDRVDDMPGIEARRHTLADAIDGFIETYDGKDSMVPSRLAWWRDEYGTMPLSRFTQAQAREGLTRLARQPAKSSAGKGRARSLGRAKSKATINRYLGALSIALNWVVEELKWIARNPAKGITRGKEPRGRVRYLSDEERKMLLAACDASAWPQLGLLVRLALSTGARLSELLTLTWSQVDLDRGVARLFETKNDEARTLVLVAAIREQLEQVPKAQRTGLLFPSARDSSKPRAFRHDWDAAVAAAKLDDFRFHDLRHSCASYLAMSGASALEIADVLGHKTLMMVKRYSHLNAAHKAALLERVTGGLLE
ncbi:MAG TPA: site-specific integrase [Gammaproteobacteria bacterium]|nr:site-specific integrase [Gammaproteobacteria bacterium]